MTMQQSETGQIAVLIVDDRDTTRKQLARLLQRTGEFQVDMAASGEDAIAQVQQARGNYDAVVMDQELGGMTGIETMKRLRASYPSLQVLMFTGQKPEAGIEALRQGAYRYILKGPSFYSDELVMTVKAMAEARRQHVRARETHWVQALLRIAQNATSLLLDQLVTEVARSARDLLGGVTSILWLSDPQNKQLRIRGWDGSLSELQRNTLRIDLGAKATQAFIQGRRPIYLPDVTDPAKAPFYTHEHRKIAQEHGWVSLLSAPMVVQEKVIGILDVYTAEQREFTAEDRDLLQTFAEQAALVVQRALVEQERTLMLERLHKVSALPVSTGLYKHAGKTSSSLKEVLDKIAQGAGELTGADFVVIYPYDPDMELFYDLDSVVTWGLQKSEWLPKSKPRQRGLTAVIRKLGELVICDAKNNIICPHSEKEIELAGLDRSQVLERVKEARFVERENIQSFVGLSLRAGQATGTSEEVGIMYIDFRTSRQFDEEQLNIIRIFGNQAGSAIQSARLLQNERFQRAQAETLQKVARTISADLDKGQAARGILDHLRGFVEYKKATVQLIEGDSRKLLARRGFRRVDQWLLRPLSEDPLANRIATEQSPVIFSDLSKDPLPAEWEIRPDTENVKSWIGLPLVFGGETQGLITLDHDTPGFYTETYQDQLIAFAGQAATAIHNARLHATLKELVNGGQALSTASTSLADTLKTVVRTARKAMGCDIAIVHPIDAGGELRLDLATMIGAKGVRTKTKKPRTSGNTRRVLEEGKLIVEDTANAERYPFLNPSPESFLHRASVRSFLGMRMQAGDQHKGVLYFDYHLPRQFTTDELEVAQLLANQAAIAIDNAQRYEQKLRDTKMLAALQEVNSAISTSSLVDVAALIAKKAKQLANATFGAVWTLDQDQQNLKALAYSGPKPRSEVVPVNASINGYVVTSGEPLIVDNLREDRRFHKEYHDFLSCMAVPLRIDGQITGTLYIKAREQEAFTDQDLALLEALADQIAIAIANAQVFEKRRKDIEVLQDINEAVVSESDKKVLQLVVDKALDVLPGEHSTLWLLEPETGDLTLAAEGGGTFAKDKGVDRIVRGTPSNNLLAVATGEPVIFMDVTEETDFLWLYPDARSAVTVPMKYRGDVIGTLNVESSQIAAFNDVHARLLDTFGDQAAIAIDNARKYDELIGANVALEGVNRKLQDRLNELEAIKNLQHEISRLVPSGEQLDLIYAATAKAMAGLMDIRNMYIALFDRDAQEFEFALWYENGVPTARSLVERRHRLSERRGLTNWIITNGEPLLIERNFEEETRRRGIEVYSDIPTKCWLGAPLLLGGQVLGVIGLNHFEREGAYDGHHRDLLMTIAGQAAVAIENARQYDLINNQLMRRIRELEAVSRMQRKASSIA